MKNKYIVKSAWLVVLLVACVAGIAQPGGVSLPGTSPYTENFNTTPGASGTTYPAGWGANNNGAWDAAMAVGNSGSTTGDNYNYGSNVGILGSGSNYDPSYLILVIANTSGKTGLKISYDVVKIREMTRDCSFNLEVSTTSATSGFSAVSGGAYSSGTIAQTTVNTYTNLDISALDNKSGAVYLRWSYASSGSGSRDAIALDNVSISWSGGAPTVNNQAVSNIFDTTAILSANLASTGGATIVERGFVWGTATNPLAGGSGVTTVPVSGTGTGTFTATPSNFPAGITIYFKGYAKTSTTYFYSPESNFLTSSKEPQAYPTSFTATALSKNDIKLDWTQVAGANGYLIIQRVAAAPTGLPADKTAYTINTALGDGTIVGLITAGTTTTTTISGLQQGTRYYYTLFPFGYNGSVAGTYNYRTVSPIPTATDSTWGKPVSALSTVEVVAGSEASGIPNNNDKVVNTITDGTQVLKLRLMDGGTAMNDADDLPTICTLLRLQAATGNQVTNWTTAIQSIALFDDSTGAKLANGTIAINLITFTGVNITAKDDNYRPLSVRMTLKKAALVENQIFRFQITGTLITMASALTSSQKATFTNLSDAAKNYIDIIPYKLRFANQPPTSIEAGAFISGQVQVEASDSFNVKDSDFTDSVTLVATAGNLYVSPRKVKMTAGVALFDTVRFNRYALSDSLAATTNSLLRAVSNRVDVVNSKLSDVIADNAFTYPQNIVHTDYNDTDAITTANSLGVMDFLLRDGGSAGDNDFEQTVLNGFTISTANAYLLRKAALYVGATKVAQADSFTTVGADKRLVFKNFTITAPDNGTTKFSLRVTFKDSAIDGHKFGFTVISATFDSTYSWMAAANAGGAVSLTDGDKNKVDVVARFTKFIQQPTNISEGTIQVPFVKVLAVDSFNNIDLATRTYSVNTLGGSTLDFRALKSSGSIADGSVTFSKLVYKTPATGVQLSIHTAGLDSLVSNLFDVLNPGWFRSVKSGNWSDIATWETSNDYGANWIAATVAPDYNLHGQITVRNGHTVQMDGLTQQANTVDELIVEQNAVLVTPAGAYNHIAVMDGPGTDITLTGHLLHNNPVAGNGIDIESTASVLVQKGAAIELAAFGDAAHWAGNANIYFEDSAFYIHNTSAGNSIGAVTMFPNASATDVAIFRIAQDYSYPGSFVNPNGMLAINGLLTIDAGKTLTVKGGGDRLLRNGIAADGNLTIADASNVWLTANAQISGAGKISVNHANSVFGVAATSYTELKNNKELNTTASNGITIAGTLNGLTNGFTGNGTAATNANGTIITAHSNGLGGLFNTTGSKNYNLATHLVFNGNSSQNSGNTAAITIATVKVDNTTGLTLSNPVTVVDTLFIGKGNVTTNTSSLLTIDKSGVIYDYSATSFINGPLKMWVDSASAKYYPVGKGTYGPVTYQSKGTSSWITLEYINNNANQNGFDTAKRGAGLMAVKATEYWKIKSSAQTNGNVELTYTANSAVTSVDTLNVRVASWNGSRWISEGPAGRNASATKVISDGLSNYNVFTIALDTACTIPSAPAFTPLNVCTGGTVNLAATGTGTVRWFINNNDAQPFAAGNTINLGVITNDTIFYTEMKNIGCYSSRVAYPVKINAIPAAPSVTGSNSLCYNTITQLTANTGGTTNWYNDINATTPAFTGDIFTSATLKNDTSFYVEKVQNGCVSTTRTKVDITVNAEITKPFSSGVEVCAGTAGVIDASANNIIRWYATNAATIPFFTGTRVTTPAITADTTYYLEAFDGGCASSRVAVTAHVLALPATPVVAPKAVCTGNNVQLTATATGTIYWYEDSASAAVNSGVAYTTAPLTTSHTYYANVFDGKCYSAKALVNVNVFTIPSSATITVASNVPTNQNTTLQTNGTAQNYEWDFGTGATPQTATGAGPHNVKWSTQGSKTVKLKMWNGNANVACSTEVINYIQVGAGVGVQEIPGATIAVYPNPATSAVAINMAFGAEQSGTIILNDINGKTVYQTGFAGAEYTGSIDVSGLAKGVYMLKVATDNGVAVHKLIVQ